MPLSRPKPNSTTAIIGGGAAGFFAAINLAQHFPDRRVILLEGTRRTLTKVKISGGGRCNVTHNCFDPRELVKNYPRGSRELLGAFHKFQPRDTIEWFAERGIELVPEADGRIFPKSNRSQTIIDTLKKEAEVAGVDLRLGALVRSIDRVEATDNTPSGFSINLHRREPIVVDRLLLATGGAPAGFDLAASLGHTVEAPVPSLFTFEIEDPILDGLQGLAFPNSELRLTIPGIGGKKPLIQKGPLLITHWGLSGPAVLKLSAWGARQLHDSGYKASLRICWLGDTHEDALRKQIQDLRQAHPKKTVVKSNPEAVPRRFWEQLCALCEIEADCRWSDVKKTALNRLIDYAYRTEVKIAGKGEFKEEFVTCGGVRLKEINFQTMESRVCPGLFFAGEILAIDGVTGGFNFQNAWTTAWIASRAP